MAHCYHHALSSVKLWGGKPEDYIRIHNWFDESKKIVADFRHRALRHHAEGIFMAETIFGTTITNSSGRAIPVRWIGEQHAAKIWDTFRLSRIGHGPSARSPGWGARSASKTAPKSKSSKKLWLVRDDRPLETRHRTVESTCAGAVYDDRILCAAKRPRPRRSFSVRVPRRDFVGRIPCAGAPLGQEKPSVHDPRNKDVFLDPAPWRKVKPARSRPGTQRQQMEQTST